MKDLLMFVLFMGVAIYSVFHPIPMPPGLIWYLGLAWLASYVGMKIKKWVDEKVNIIANAKKGEGS